MAKEKIWYENQKDLWKWGREGASHYFMTNEEGMGLFYIHPERNERKQLIGTLQFSLRGLKDPKAKIRRWMNGKERK